MASRRTDLTSDRRTADRAAGTAFALLAACGGVAAAQTPLEQVAAQVGLVHTHTGPGSAEIEYMAGGVAVGDFDRDGDQDVYAIGGRTGVDRFFLNNADGTFTDATAAAGLGLTHRGCGVAAGDVDRDGDLDIFVTSLGPTGAYIPGQHYLLLNNGDATFAQAPLAGGVNDAPGALQRDWEGSESDSFSPTFGDFDTDGDLDLFIAGWRGNNRLFENDGTGWFTDITRDRFDVDLEAVNGFVGRFADLDRDGITDLLLIADFGTSKLLLGNGDGTFRDETAAWGAGLDSNGMGQSLIDIDNDGDLDWYVSSLINNAASGGSGNMLYIHQPGGGFAERSVECGVNAGFWSWGNESQDFDHDGWPDLVATNGWVPPFINPTLFWLSNAPADPADLAFDERSAELGMNHVTQGRGLLTFDYDLDGDRDILIASNGGALALYRNNLPPAGSSFLDVELRTYGEPGLAPAGVGSLVRVTAQGLTQTRSLDGGSHFLAQSELTAHFGFASGEAGGGVAETVTIEWANGETTTLSNVPLGQRLVVTARLSCPVDWNGDGAVTFGDVTAFINDFTAAPPHPQADVTGDGSINFGDVIGFVDRFNAGCD